MQYDDQKLSLNNTFQIQMMKDKQTKLEKVQWPNKNNQE